MARGYPSARTGNRPDASELTWIEAAASGHAGSGFDAALAVQSDGARHYASRTMAAHRHAYL